MFALLAAAVAMPVRGSVLCVGPNGHAAIELPHGTRHCSALADRTPAPHAHGADHWTGGCTDIPLVMMEGVLGPDREDTLFDSRGHVLPALIQQMEPVSGAAPTSWHRLRRPEADSVSGLRLSLRSTVLLL